MSNNETLIQVPTNLSDPFQLTLFLRKLVEKIDVVLGYRGQDPYLASSDMATLTETLNTLPATLDNLESKLSKAGIELTELSKSVADLRNRFQQLLQALNTTQSLDIAYRDFNFSGYGTLKGFYQFTALGSEITNPPTGAALVGPTSYTFILSSYVTSGGGVVQEVYVTSATTKTFHRRAGDTFALVLSLGWF